MNAELLPSLPALPIIWDSSQISAGMPVGEIQNINELWENVHMNNEHYGSSMEEIKKSAMKMKIFL
jgi:hypothetical protein